MAKRKLESKLINKSEITEKIVLINGSDTDYISVNGNVYKDYGNSKYLKKSVFKNNANGYMYCGITYKTKQVQRRVHILVAEAFIENTNNYPYVMHLDNDKTNNVVDNLMWGTASLNTQQAFDDGLLKNSSGYDDSQSIPICYFDLNYNYLGEFGSMSIAAKELGVTKTLISQQCKLHGPSGKPRKGYYYRYLDEYKNYGFVL